jgi:hypothetical protein
VERHHKFANVITTTVMRPDFDEASDESKPA